MDDLSPRQREILEFMISSVEQSGIVPSYREIGEALGNLRIGRPVARLSTLAQGGFQSRWR